MEDVQDDGACKVHCYSRIFIVRSFEGSAKGSKFTWLQIAICPNLAVPAPPL
jgi:hypothetical protein